MRNNNQSGVVSIIIVLFSMLLLTIITVSFTRIMLQGQQQTSSNDLSQSALDSAQAGVEDAKRALVQYKSDCLDPTSDQCLKDIGYINSGTCNQILSILNTTTDTTVEVPIEENGTSNNLNQAYTCLKIDLSPNDYLGKLSTDESAVIPLRGESGFNKVRISWYTRDDNAHDPVYSLNQSLLTPTNWGEFRPPMIRAQLIQYDNSGFKLDDLQSTGNNNSSLFLLPVTGSGLTTTSFALDKHRNPVTDSSASGGGPALINCSTTYSPYACTATISLPLQVNASAGIDSRVAYLRLTTLYKGASYRIILMKDDTVVGFNAVQPEIDSTGRADGIFRRVKTRVEYAKQFPYPVASVWTTGNFCKDFSITDQVADYNDYAGCNP